MGEVNGRLFLNNVSLGVYGDAVGHSAYRDAKLHTLLATANEVLAPGAEAPGLRLVDALPMFSKMPITLARFSPGVIVNDQQTQVSQGYVDNTSLSAG